MNTLTFLTALLPFCGYVWALLYFRWDLAIVSAVGFAAVMFLTGYTPPDIIYFAVLMPAAVWFWRDGRPAWHRWRTHTPPPGREAVRGLPICPCPTCQQAPQ